MSVKFLLLLILTGSGLISRAQEAKQELPAKKGCSCSFSSINNLVVVTGKKGTGGVIQTINGVRYKTWFMGAGIGLDVYFKTINLPIFLDVRKDIFDKPVTPFVYGDAGIHVPPRRREYDSQSYDNVYLNGFYSDAGIGYKFGIKKAGSLLMSTGLSYLKQTRRNVYVGPCLSSPCYENVFTYKYNLFRTSLKIGWQF